MSTSETPVKQTKEQAIQKVRAHVEPKACFIWYLDNKRGWAPIKGTGCAHYVSHQLGIKGGNAAKCGEGYLLRVPQLVARLTRVQLKDIAVNDVWANDSLDHTGIVEAVDRTTPAAPRITIRHSSSRLERVSSNDWATYFSKSGKFYRSGASATVVPTQPVPTGRSLLPFGGINGPM